MCLENSKEEVILGITIDNKLTFDNHIKSMCRKAGQKLNDKTSTFEHLLQANNEITIHQRNLQVLMVKDFKIINGFAPPVMEDFFLFVKTMSLMSQKSQ